DDPEGRIAAVREVFTELGAEKLPEVLVVNKADAADPAEVERLLAGAPRSIAVSARTGAGIEELLALVDEALPRPEVRVRAEVPYSRGDLVSRVHSEGLIGELEQNERGTLLSAEVHAELAAALAPFSVPESAQGGRAAARREAPPAPTPAGPPVSPAAFSPLRPAPGRRRRQDHRSERNRSFVGAFPLFQCDL